MSHLSRGTCTSGSSFARTWCSIRTQRLEPATDEISNCCLETTGRTKTRCSSKSTPIFGLTHTAIRDASHDRFGGFGIACRSHGASRSRNLHPGSSLARASCVTTNALARASHRRKLESFVLVFGANRSCEDAVLVESPPIFGLTRVLAMLAATTLRGFRIACRLHGGSGSRDIHPAASPASAYVRDYERGGSSHRRNSSCRH